MKGRKYVDIYHSHYYYYILLCLLNSKLFKHIYLWWHFSCLSLFSDSPICVVATRSEHWWQEAPSPFWGGLTVERAEEAEGEMEVDRAGEEEIIDDAELPGHCCWCVPSALSLVLCSCRKLSGCSASSRASADRESGWCDFCWVFCSGRWLRGI